MISKKGSYLKIEKTAECYIIEAGSEYDCYRIDCDFVDLITIKNEIQELEERAKKNESDNFKKLN